MDSTIAPFGTEEKSVPPLRHTNVGQRWFALRHHAKEQPEVRHGGVSHMHFDTFSFGSIQIDGKTYEKDVVIDRGEIRRRKKGPSKKFREDFGHTPLSIEEKLPWNCRQLVIGTGAYGNLPVMEEVAREAERRRIRVLRMPTPKAIEVLNENPKNTNAVLHVTC
jgi:hypothetical protein